MPLDRSRLSVFNAPGSKEAIGCLTMDAAKTPQVLGLKTRSKALFFMSVCSRPSSERNPGLHRPSSIGQRRRSLLLALGLSAVLAACGKKGPLELPPTSDGRPAGDEPAAGERK